MITLPTTELIGCLTDVLPQISDEKGALAGVRVAWTGESLTFTTYDVYAGAVVEWVPGEGAEGDIDDDDNETLYVEWGGDDDPWATWIWLPQAKEILKLFKLPAKLWRFPVQVKCTLAGDLIVERVDSPRGNRELRIPGDPDMLKRIPDVRAAAESVIAAGATLRDHVGFAAGRIGAFGAIRPHGALALRFGPGGDPVAVTAGSRFAGFIYPQGETPRRYSVLRDGAGFMPGQTSGGKSV